MMDGAQVHLADTCSLCNNTEHVNWFCNDCQESLCDSCKSIHERGKKTRNDDIVRMKEPNKQHEVIVSEMATGDSWVPQREAKGSPLRVVLLGTTGTGKSATGNTLLGNKIFLSSSRRTSVTGECSVAEVDRFGTRLVVVDTPGVLDTRMSERDLKVMLKECTHLACPGVHAFLYLMKIGERDIGGKDKKTFDLLTKMFGEEFLNYTIIVFSAKDCLGDDTLNQIVSDLPDACQKFINSCKGGYLAISNNSATDEKVQAARQVVNKVKDLVQENDGGSYVNALFDEENEKIQERMDHILKLNEDNENKIQNAEREKQSFIESFRDNKPTIDQSEQLQIMEYNILQLRKKSIDRKGARLAASNEIEYDKIVKQFITGVVVAGGVAAGGFAVIEMRFI